MARFVISCYFIGQWCQLLKIISKKHTDTTKQHQKWIHRTQQWVVFFSYLVHSCFNGSTVFFGICFFGESQESNFPSATWWKNRRMSWRKCLLVTTPHPPMQLPNFGLLSSDVHYCNWPCRWPVFFSSLRPLRVESISWFSQSLLEMPPTTQIRSC